MFNKKLTGLSTSKVFIQRLSTSRKKILQQSIYDQKSTVDLNHLPPLGWHLITCTLFLGWYQRTIPTNKRTNDTTSATTNEHNFVIGPHDAHISNTICGGVPTTRTPINESKFGPRYLALYGCTTYSITVQLVTLSITVPLYTHYRLYHCIYCCHTDHLLVLLLVQLARAPTTPYLFTILPQMWTRWY